MTEQSICVQKYDLTNLLVMCNRKARGNELYTLEYTKTKVILSIHTIGSIACVYNPVSLIEMKQELRNILRGT